MVLGIDVPGLLTAYGYWAVFVAVAVESAGVPVPGETMLLTAAVYAGASGHLSIALVIICAATGAILGDNGGYLIGRTVGERVLGRFGGARGRALVVGRYVFERHGGKMVLFGRFVAVLRIFAALLAGATHMPWPRFARVNTIGGVLWATLMGLLGYGLGASITGPLGIAGLVAAVLVVLVIVLAVRRNGRRWEREAMHAIQDDDLQRAA